MLSHQISEDPDIHHRSAIYAAQRATPCYMLVELFLHTEFHHHQSVASLTPHRAISYWFSRLT
jgi:hypothetical protein